MRSTQARGGDSSVPHSEPLLTLKEAAEFLRLHPRTVRDHVRRGRDRGPPIPPISLGRHGFRKAKRFENKNTVRGEDNMAEVAPSGRFEPIHACDDCGSPSRRSKILFYDDPEAAREVDFGTWESGWYQISFDVCTHCRTWSLAEVRRSYNPRRLTAETLKSCAEGTALLAECCGQRGKPA